MRNQTVAPSYIVDKSGHQLIVENVFVQVAAARPCEEESIILGYVLTGYLRCLLTASSHFDLVQNDNVLS